MRSVTSFAVLCALASLVAVPAHAEEDAASSIDFLHDLPRAFEAAKAADKPLMICINSKRVDRRGRLEPAAKELRERTYRHPRIVELSKKFVCAFVTAESSADDFGELRARYQIDGEIVSPQHLFAYPDGKLIYREEYWPYGTGDGSVDALETMMNKALAKDRERRGDTTTPQPDAGGDVALPEDGGVRPVPEDGEARERWIEEQLGLARGPDEDRRREALNALLDADREGDVLARVLALLESEEKNLPVLVEVVRALGRPELFAASDAVEDLLDHKEASLRGVAAVSLEYIGNPESVRALLRRAPREDDEAVANHMYRALGRCGWDESRAHKLLLKKAQGSKSHFASYGPIIGLAYCVDQKRVRRDVEKLLKREGIPGGRRGGWRGGGKRALLTWCLTEVGDAGSAEFIREEIMPAVPDGRWSSRILDFYEAAAKVLEGDEASRATVHGGVQFAIGGGGGGGGRGTPGEPRPRLYDEARKHRADHGFTPKGDFAGA